MLKHEIQLFAFPTIIIKVLNLELVKWRVLLTRQRILTVFYKLLYKYLMEETNETHQYEQMIGFCYNILQMQQKRYYSKHEKTFEFEFLGAGV